MNKMNLKISVIVCTHNRGQSIKNTLDSLLEQSLPKELYEIIAVDNGSTDNTKQFIHEAVAQATNIKYIYEPIIGLSRARNTGISESKGEIVAFIDDDAIADRFWLEKLSEAYSDEDIWCVGGMVKAKWPVEKPDWLPDNLLSYLGVISYGEYMKELKSPHYPFGVNMSFSRRAIERCGMFSEDLGRKGSNLLSNEEYDYCYNLEKSGGKVVYTPHALVHHCISPSRLTKKWFMRRAYWQGRSQVILEQKYFGKAYVQNRLHQLRKYITDRIRNIILGKDHWNFELPFRALYYFGYLYGWILSFYSIYQTQAPGNSNKNSRPKILYICPDLPYPPNGGHKIRKLNTVKQLAKEYDLTLVPFFIGYDDNENTENISHLMQYCKHFLNYKKEALRRPKKNTSLGKWFDKYFYIFLELKLRRIFPRRSYISHDLYRLINEELRRVKYDIVFVEKLWMAPYVAGKKGVIKILSQHDVLSVVAKRLMKNGSLKESLRSWKDYIILREYEKKVCTMFDACTACSDIDKEKLIQLTNAKVHVETIPNGVDTSFFEYNPQLPESGLVFTGVLDYRPNIDAVLWFVKDIFPRIMQAVPNIRLTVAGRNPPSEIMKLKSQDIDVFANVPDIRPYIYDNLVYIVPLLAGGGTRLKILEAMSCGRPVVSTTLGAEGLGYVNERDIMIADNPQDFTESTVRLLKEPALRKMLVENGRKLVEEKYDWNIIGEKLNRMMSSKSR